MKKKQKGEYGYIAYQKKYELVKTVILFLIPLALFFGGLIVTKTRLNLLTIVAVLGMLPACKSAVILIMYLKGRGITDEDHTLFAPQMEEMIHSYDNIFTTYEKSYEVPALVIRCGNVCGISGRDYGAQALSALQTHIETTLKQEGFHTNCKIFEKKEQYIERLKSISELQEEEKDRENAQGILQVLHDISL